MRQIIQEYNSFFWDFTLKYDTQNTNIQRKVIHSYEVARNCYAIASYLGLSENARNLSYLIGLLHDVGRFEQWKLYQTYNDKKSIDHGDLSFDLLKDMNLENKLQLSNKDVHTLLLSIKYHTKPYNGSDGSVILFNDILKNADAFSNVLTTANGAQQMTEENNGVSQEILDDFLQCLPLYIYSPKTKLDRALMLSACCYYVKYDFLREQIIKCRYIDNIYQTFSKYLNSEDKEIYFNALKQLEEQLNTKEELNITLKI